MALDVIFIWVPTLASILLSFTNYQGIGGITAANIVGLKNYKFLFTGYSLFWPALSHNLLWLAFFVFIASPIGIFFAVLLDREIRGSRFYQNIFYFPGRPVAGRRRLHLGAPVRAGRLHRQRPGPDQAEQRDRLAGQSPA